MNELVKMSKIKKTYDDKRYILNGLDFSLKKGEIATIWGASGCGKSTFLNIVGLLDNFTEGSYEFNGHTINRKKLNSYYRQRATDIGFVFQAYYLIDSISVRENILMPFLYNNKYIDKSVMADLDNILTDFNITELRDNKVSLLSGGEKQRVAISRAMIKKPKLIIADEPTGNLDDANTKLVIKAFNKIAESGTAIIVVTHNRHLSFDNGKVYSLEGGLLKPC